MAKRSAVALQTLEQAARLADSAGDVPLGFEIRYDMCNRCYYRAAWDLLFVHFAWLVARHDEDPARFPARRVLWFYKWILSSVDDDPNVPLSRIDQLLEDFALRLSRAGYSLRPLHQARASRAAAVRDLDALETYQRAWKAARRDGLSDCLVCELDGDADRLETLGRVDEAIEQWIAVLRHPKKCDLVPAITRSSLLRPLFVRGRRRSASAYHRHGYQDVLSLVNVGAFSRHLSYEVARGGVDAALAMLERHLPMAVARPLAGARHGFYSAAVFALDLFESRGLRDLPLRLPEAIPVPSGGGRVETGPLRAWFHGQCVETAAAFDRRDGGTVWMDKYEGFAERWTPE